MVKAAEESDPTEPARSKPAGTERLKGRAPDGFGVPSLAKGERRADVEDELRRWYALGDAERAQAIRAAALGARDWSIEVFVHVSAQAHAAGNRRLLNQSFAAFVKRATPLLLSQAWGSAENEREDQVQEILTHTCRAIVVGSADYAEINFADFAQKKAISLHRSRVSTLEGSFEQLEPTPEADPIDDLPDREPNPEGRALLNITIGKLEGRLRAVFIRYHVMQFTYKEIAAEYEVDESTVRLWIKQANKIAGLRGDNK